MKITSWNVNGLRAILGKGFREWVNEQSPDVLCLQEIKARPEQISDTLREIDGYKSLWNPAQRPGYSGVAVYHKIPPQRYSFGMGIEKFDIEGRVIRLEYPEFTLFNIYFPNGQRGLERVQFKLEFYAELLRICDDLLMANRPVMITGDFNTAHREIDLANPKENETTSGFLPEERVWIDYFIDHGFVDVYRNLYPEKVQYTWWTYRFAARRRNIGWRLDYYLVSQNFVENVKDVIISDQVEGSDHCPVTLIM